jgi:hypothetical protein
VSGHHKWSEIKRKGGPVVSDLPPGQESVVRSGICPQCGGKLEEFKPNPPLPSPALKTHVYVCRAETCKYGYVMKDKP